MIDIDALLRADAARWNTSSQAEPPNLDEVLGHTWAEAPRSRRRLAALCAAAAVVVIAVGIGVVAPRLGGSQRLTSPPGTATMSATTTAPLPAAPHGLPAWVPGPSGERLPYDGPVPWRDAVRQPGSRVVTVMADGDAMKTAFFTCAAPVVRAAVLRTVGGRATILVGGYAVPFHGVCAGVAHPLQPLQVTLPHGASLTSAVDDADSAVHTLLDPATAPIATSPLVNGLTRDIRWDDRYGVVTATYSDGNLAHGVVKIDTGTAAQLASVNETPFRTPQFSIGGAYATMHPASGRKGEYSVYWTASPTHSYAVTISATLAGRPITLSNVEDICRSIR